MFIKDLKNLWKKTIWPV